MILGTGFDPDQCQNAACFPTFFNNGNAQVSLNMAHCRALSAVFYARFRFATCLFEAQGSTFTASQ